jgi:hypothetical protein
MLWLNEIFNPNVAYEIYNNWDRYAEEISSVSRRGSVYTPKELIFKYFERSLNGEKTTEYYQSFGEGRLQAKHSLSLQNLPRRFRHSVAKGLYKDYDMKNAHPVILLFLCRKFAFPCEELTYYVKNRDKCLNEMNVPREVAKRAYLALTNGGRDVGITNLTNISSHFQRYRDEMTELHKKFTKEYPDKFEKWCKYKKEEKDKDTNLNASFVNSLMCMWENSILEVIMGYFSIKRGDTAVLCFDGIMIPSSVPCDLNEISSLVKKKLGIEIEMTVKDFDNPVNLIHDLPKAPRISLDFFNDHDNLVKKKFVELKWLEMWRVNCMALVSAHGDPFFMTKEEDSEGIEYWKPVKSHKCLNSLDKDVFVENPHYNKKYANLVSDMKGVKLQKEKKRSDFKKKTEKWLYTSIKQYLEDIIRRGEIRLYNNIGFKPYLLRDGCPNYFFNTFTPFPFDGTDDPGKELFINSLWYKHLAEEMFNNDEGELNHFLDCIADALQDSSNLKETAHIFYSKQGCGKGTLADFIELLVGKANIVRIGDANRYLKSNFNMDSANKTFKIFEEVKGNDSVFSKSDLIKDIISAPYERVEPKGFEAYQTRNVSRCFFFSNNEDSVRVERNDRRFTLHMINDTYARDIKYFGKIREEFKNEEFLKSAFHFFINRKYDALNVRLPYETQYKKEQRLKHEHRAIKFIINFCEEHIGRCDSPILIDKNHLDAMYMDEWKIVIKQTAQRELRKELEKLGVPVKRKVREGDRGQTRFYILNPIILEKQLRETLDDKTFTIDFLDNRPRAYFPE